MSSYFISDIHFETPSLCLNTYSLRPFKPTDWDTMLLDAINSSVDRQDILYILGDFAAKRPGYWRSKICCKSVFLIIGNHDNWQKCLNVFGGNLRTNHVTKVHGVKTFLSHYPAAFWNGSHKGWLHLYGHCHNQREETLDTIWPGRRSMDVSPESAYMKLGAWRPFSDTEIFELIGNNPGHDPVGFYLEYQEEFHKQYDK